MMNDLKVNRKTFYYEYINGQCFLKSRGVAECLCSLLSDDDRDLILKNLGIDKKGRRI